MGLFKSKSKSSGPFEFRVSDAVEVPLRGYLVRLRLLNGDPALPDLSPGKRLRLRAPSGAERTVIIKDHAVTAGRPSQERLERTRELDLVIAADEAVVEGAPVDIGWTAIGPVED